MIEWLDMHPLAESIGLIILTLIICGCVIWHVARDLPVDDEDEHARNPFRW
jgi:hypothetical protein